ncbi:hypothetical protein NN561_008300 [Cricetulus griseus]
MRRPLQASPREGVVGSAHPLGARGDGPAPHRAFAATPGLGTAEAADERRAPGLATHPKRAPAERGRGLALPERRPGSAVRRPAGPVFGSRKARASRSAGERRPPPRPASQADRRLPSVRASPGPELGRRLSHGSRAAKADRGPWEGERRAVPTREEGFQGRRGTGHLAPWRPPLPPDIGAFCMISSSGYCLSPLNPSQD